MSGFVVLAGFFLRDSSNIIEQIYKISDIERAVKQSYAYDCGMFQRL
jgi:hypothetical protein